MKIQLKEDAPDHVEVGLGPYIFIFDRGEAPVEVAANHWPELERQGYFEIVPEEAPPAESTTETSSTETSTESERNEADATREDEHSANN